MSDPSQDKEKKSNGTVRGILLAPILLFIFFFGITCIAFTEFQSAPWETTPSVLFHLLTRTWWGDTGLILKNTLPVMWGIVWQGELSLWQAPDSRFVDFMVTSFKVTTGWNMPSDNLFECWLWKALNISASYYYYYRICSSICAVLPPSLIIISRKHLS